MEKFFFLRNDDVRETIDISLIEITNLCIKHKVPISHAVEPANLSNEVIEWLITLKKNNPNLIEIVQHGYNHNKYNIFKNQEFGGNRTFEDQYKDIKKGKFLMDKYFGELWEPIFSFPYGKYNSYTLRAIKELGYLGITSSISFNFKSRIKNKIGHILNKDIIFGKNVSYHTKLRKTYNLPEISVSINIIEKILDYNTAIHYSFDNIKRKIYYNFKYTYVIGLLLHHRYHFDSIELIEKIIKFAKSQNLTFSNISNLLKLIR